MGVPAKLTNPLPVDGNFAPIQVANKIQNDDGTRISPLTVSNTALDITIPDGAIRIQMFAVGADLRIGDNSTLDGSAVDKGYYLLENGDPPISLPCADQTAIYVLRNAGTDVTLYFTFEML